jgi:hypothetical protein
MSTLDGGDWSASNLGRFTPGGRAPGTNLIGGWVTSRAGLDAVEYRKISSLAALIYRQNLKKNLKEL